MLEFWFNPQVNLTKKLLFLAVVIALTATLYFIDPLPLQTILMFLATGVIFLICRYIQQHFSVSKPHGILARLMKWIPIALLLALIFMHMKNGEILLPGAQGIGFMALAICLFSPLSLLNQHRTHPDA